VSIRETYFGEISQLEGKVVRKNATGAYPNIASRGRETVHCKVLGIERADIGVLGH